MMWDVPLLVAKVMMMTPPGGPNGPIVYMDANPDLDIILNRIENAGGKIIKPKKAISEDHEFLTTFLDSEGNRMALHPMK